MSEPASKWVQRLHHLGGDAADARGAAARFAFPRGLAVDREGNVYVAESSNNRIRKIRPNGLVSTWKGRPMGTSTG